MQVVILLWPSALFGFRLFAIQKTTIAQRQEDIAVSTSNDNSIGEKHLLGYSEKQLCHD